MTSTNISTSFENTNWHLRTEQLLTDAEAAALTFRAAPKDLRLGAYVQVQDAGGIRVGHVASATYHNRYPGPAYVLCTIDLM